MTLAGDLLTQSAMLAAQDPRRPKQASLRRSVSTAYYSLFHLLVDDAASMLVGGSRLKAAVARSFEHAAMRVAATKVATAARRPGGNPQFEAHLRLPVSAGLQQVCDLFVELQELRHRADYDLGVKFTRVEALAAVSQAERAHRLWPRERNSHNGKAFVLASAKLLGSRG